MPEKKDALDQRVAAQIDEANEKTESKGHTAGTDVYGSVECRESDTGVEIPTEEAVEEAKHWSDEVNRM